MDSGCCMAGDGPPRDVGVVQLVVEFVSMSIGIRKRASIMLRFHCGEATMTGMPTTIQTGSSPNTVLTPAILRGGLPTSARMMLSILASDPCSPSRVGLVLQEPAASVAESNEVDKGLPIAINAYVTFQKRCHWHSWNFSSFLHGALDRYADYVALHKVPTQSSLGIPCAQGHTCDHSSDGS